MGGSKGALVEGALFAFGLTRGCGDPSGIGRKIRRKLEASGRLAGRSRGTIKAVASNMACKVNETSAVQRRTGWVCAVSSPANMASSPQQRAWLDACGQLLLGVKTPSISCSEVAGRK